MTHWIAPSLLIVSCLCGCSDVTSLIPSPSTPFFQPTAEDAHRVALLTDELTKEALQCLQAANCEQVYYSRALVSLFENQQAARASFRHVIQHNPASPLASSSQLWLRLLGEEEISIASAQADLSPVTDLVAGFVREWMEQEVTARQKPDKIVTPRTQVDQPVEQSRVVQGIQKQLRERERQIADLRSQLEALKSIDEEHAAKVRRVKPPTSLKTADHDAP